MAFVLTAFTTVVFITFIELFVLKMLNGTAFHRAIDYCLIPFKVFVYTLWKFYWSKQRNSALLKICNVWPGSYPLTYRKLGNLLASFGRNDSAYDEEECYRLVYSRLNYYWTRQTVQLLVAMPVVVYEMEKMESLPFAAEANENIFGDDLKLVLTPSIVTNVSQKEIDETLKCSLEEGRGSEHKLLALFQVEHEKLRYPSRVDVSNAFTRILKPVCSYLSLILRSQISYPVSGSPLLRQEIPTNCQIDPHYSIFNEQRKVVCVVDIWKPCIFGEIPTHTIMKDDLCDEHIGEIVKDLQISMIVTSSRFGILYGGYYLILIEFVDDQSYYEKKYLCESSGGGTQIKLPYGENLHIPFKTLILDLHSTGPSFIEGLLYFLYRAKQAKRVPRDSSIFKYFHLASGIPLKKALSWKTDARWLRTSNTYDSYVFEIQAKHLNDVILDPVLGNEMVIMNIYSPLAFWRRYDLSIEERMELARVHFFNEKKAIDQLKGSQDYNNIYLKHWDVEIDFTKRSGAGIITGYAIISKSIKSDPIPQTSETYELAKRQLEIIHEAGVIHGSINKRNIVFAAGKIYLYNLNHSKLMKKYTPAERDEMIKADFRDLRSVFHELPPN